MPRSHFVKQLLGVVDVVGCSGCRSAGPSAMRGGRSHRGTGSYRASARRRSRRRAVAKAGAGYEAYQVKKLAGDAAG